ncbi:MAG: hypothetical protein P8Y70_04310 [Candidatus Lokiarchaeota archaeon]
MVDKNKIMGKVSFPKEAGNFFVLYEDQEAFTYGWISLEGSIEEFKTRLEDEIEYAWGFEYADLNEYNIFNIEIGNHYDLQKISDEEYYQKIKYQEEIYIVVLHKNIESRLIENFPEIYEWLRGDVFYL